MVEIFKTNVQEEVETHILLDKLSKRFPELCINFDLDDCDKILRVEGDVISPANIIELMDANGYLCMTLD